MAEISPNQVRAHADAGDFENFPLSTLEASLATAACEPRPNSRAQDNVYRHTALYQATIGDGMGLDDIEYDLDVPTDGYPFDTAETLADVFGAAKYKGLLGSSASFDQSTEVDCLSIEESHGEWLSLKDASFRDCVQNAVDHSDPSKKRILAFFPTLSPAQGTAFGARSSLSRASVEYLFSSLDINPLFLPNLLGRPDYWAPETYSRYSPNGSFIGIEFFCQHPRWNINVQGSPLSVFMKHDITRNLTTYLIVSNPANSVVNAARKLLDLTLEATVSRATSQWPPKELPILKDPFDIHVLLANLSFETSKYHVKRFRRFMWTQVNLVDDNLSGLEYGDRDKLKGLTKELQVISHNADSLIANANVALLGLAGMRLAHERLHAHLSRSDNQGTCHHAQTLAEPINYLHDSNEKQKMWLLNYKARKDGTMNLVYNLVTQQDATNNIQIAREMKTDSSSMNTIAAMTMVFLPGTFTSTVLGAGIFTATASDSHNVKVSGIWWLWAVTTLPLTMLVVCIWLLYQSYRTEDGFKARWIGRLRWVTGWCRNGLTHTKGEKTPEREADD